MAVAGFLEQLGQKRGAAYRIKVDVPSGDSCHSEGKAGAITAVDLCHSEGGTGVITAEDSYPYDQ